MQPRTQFTIGCAALVLTGVALSAASAGNAEQSGVEYFSVALVPGQYLSYTGGDSDAVLLVDDITYSGQLDPCEVSERCSYFTEEAIETFDDDPEFSYENQGWLPSPLGASYNQNTESSSTKNTVKWSEASGAHFRATVEEEIFAGGFQVFDAFSHSTHAEVLGRERTETAAQFRVYERTIPSSDPGAELSGSWLAAAGGAGVGVGTGVGLSSYATSTSESRHYQSPQIVQHDNEVWFKLQSAGTGLGAPNWSQYVEAMCLIKGRVVLDINDAPVENNDVTVTTAP